MVEKKKDDKKELEDDEVEEIFDAVWENWSSRRRCEQRHTPEYLKNLTKKEK